MSGVGASGKLSGRFFSINLHQDQCFKPFVSYFGVVLSEGPLHVILYDRHSVYKRWQILGTLSNRFFIPIYFPVVNGLHLVGYTGDT